MDRTNISEEARRARNEYQRSWRAANKDKVKASNDRYWQRRAERDKAQQKEASEA